MAPAGAHSPAIHFTEDVTGQQFSCDPGAVIYTVTSGVIAFTERFGAAANDGEFGENQNFTVTITPRRVVLENAGGDEFRLAGSSWVGGSFNGNTGGEVFTATDTLQIVGRGSGTVGSVNLKFHVTDQPNNFFLNDFDFGNCEFVESEPD